MFINPIGNQIVMYQEAATVGLAAKSFEFEGTFKLVTTEEVPNTHHALKVPFKASKPFGLNRFLATYLFEIEGQPLDSTGRDNSTCQTDNNVFDAVVDAQGKEHRTDSYYGDGESLPAGEYTAAKGLYVNTTEEMQAECYSNVLAKIQSTKQLNVYYSNVFLTKASLSLVKKLRLEN
jgi:hypothetical protein